ncbi:hypothetical protein [Clostridium sp. B9]|uniref:hypothetical protein n=1 Tax=Clostridium sp. B9 TaxID=3423224 RepID=UPI003D2F26DB
MKKKVAFSIGTLFVAFILAIVYLGLYHNDYIGENKSLNEKVVYLIENGENQKLDFSELSESTAFEWDEVYLISPYRDVSDFFESVNTYAPDKTYNSEINDVFMLAFVKNSDKLGKDKLIEYTYLPSNYIDSEMLKEIETNEGIYHYINGDLI